MKKNEKNESGFLLPFLLLLLRGVCFLDDSQETLQLDEEREKERKKEWM